MIHLYNQDCMIAMKTMKDKQFDLAIVDPPYGLTKGMDKRGVCNIPHGGKRANKNQHLYTEIKGNWNVAPPDEYFVELMRVSKNQIIFGGNYFPILWKEPTRSMIVWDKQQVSLKHADLEMAWCSMDRNAKLYRYRWAGNHAGNGVMVPRYHPTQKPICLYEWLLDNYAKQGDSILDTHLGSGSIAIACHDKGFDLTAYEINKKYFNRANDRLIEHQKQYQLFSTDVYKAPEQIDLFDD